MSTTRELIEGYAGWWKGWSWDWFVTLTFRGDPSLATALNKFKGWISDLAKEHGTSEFRFVRVVEKGAFGDNIHIHLLVAGLKEKARLFPGELRDRWERIAGHAAILRFDPDKGGVHYMLKTLDPARDFDVDFHFPDGRTTGAAGEPLTEQSKSNNKTKSFEMKRRNGVRIYKDTLLQKKTTKSMVVYGNQELRALYVPKEMLRAVFGRKDNYPKEVVLSLRTTGSDPVSSIDRDQKRFAPGSQLPRKEANGKVLGKDIRTRDSR